jgi:2'-5' RNA ligase
VYCDYSLETAEKIASWCVLNLIPVPLDPDKYHTTILYSRKPVPKAQEIIDSMDKIDLSVIGFKLFGSEDDLEIRALVLELKAPQLINLHKKLISAGGTHDYDDYTPHLTVSYQVPKNLDLSTLKLPDFKVTICGFKTEPLDLNWRE